MGIDAAVVISASAGGALAAMKGSKFLGKANQVLKELGETIRAIKQKKAVLNL